MTSPLDSRRKSLEDEFFHNQEQAQLDKLRETVETEEARERLKEASGMQDEAVINALVDLGINEHTMLALSLVPLIKVAWADGEIQEGERDTVMLTARAKGIDKDSPAHALLESWLTRQPKETLFDAWKSYIGVLRPKLSEDQAKALQSKVLELAEEVAESAGGILGFAAVARSEKSALDDIRAAFDS